MKDTFCVLRVIGVISEISDRAVNQTASHYALHVTRIGSESLKKGSVEVFDLFLLTKLLQRNFNYFAMVPSIRTIP